MEEYPNISKKRALESINTVILYLRQFGFNNKIAVRCSRELVGIERFIEELKEKEWKRN